MRFKVVSLAKFFKAKVILEKRLKAAKIKASLSLMDEKGIILIEAEGYLIPKAMKILLEPKGDFVIRTIASNNAISDDFMHQMAFNDTFTQQFHEHKQTEDTYNVKTKQRLEICLNKSDCDEN